MGQGERIVSTPDPTADRRPVRHREATGPSDSCHGVLPPGLAGDLQIHDPIMATGCDTPLARHPLRETLEGLSGGGAEPQGLKNVATGGRLVRGLVTDGNR